MWDHIISYFDLTSQVFVLRGAEIPGALPWWWAYLQYICFVCGIAAQAPMVAYQTTRSLRLPHLREGLGLFFISAFVGVLLFPAVYKNSIDPEKPIFVTCCATIALGFSWQSLVKTAGVPLGLTNAFAAPSTGKHSHDTSEKQHQQ